MKRDLISWSLIAIPVAIFGGFVWFTQNPSSPLLEGWAELPLAGRWVAQLQERYSTERQSSERAGESSPSAVGSRSTSILDLTDRGNALSGTPAETQAGVVFGRPDYVWLSPGDRLLAQPRQDAEPVLQVTAIANVAVVSRQSEWLQVRSRGLLGWIESENVEQPQERTVLATPRPVLPLDDLDLSPDVLAKAQEYLANGGSERRLGPYRCWTDVGDLRILESLDAVAENAESAFRELLQLPLVGTARSTIVLFESSANYHEFRRWQGIRDGARSAGHSASGLVALFVGELDVEEVAGTLLHELAHLMTRRSIGPALPLWLNEGIATALGHSKISPEGSIEVRQLGGRVVSSDGETRWSGGLASLERLRKAAAGSRLDPPAEFVRTPWDSPARDIAYAYAYASIWTRYLVEGTGAGGEERAVAFRGFLSDVSRGGELSIARLEQKVAPVGGIEVSAFADWILARSADS